MSRVDVLPPLVSRLSTVQIKIGGVMPSAPKYPDSFDAEISKLGNYKRWVLGGSALRVWEDDLRSRVQELIRENEGEIYNGHGLREATTCHCWMLGRDQPSAGPTVVIAHGVPRILKRTMRVIDKHKILKERGFELRGCPKCDLHLLTDASSAQLTQHVDGASLNLPLSLCGAEVAVGHPARYATLGGILTIAGELYAITVAHVFTEKVHVQTQNVVSDSNLILYDMDWANSSSEDCSLEHDSLEGDNSDEEDAANVGVSRSTTLGMGRLQGLPPFDHSNHEHAIQMGKFPLSRLSSKSPFRIINDNLYDGMDWALLKVPWPWNLCVNGASRNDSSWLKFEKIREDGPRGPVLVVTRKGIVSGVGAGTASSIKLKGSSTYRNVWSVQSEHPLDKGDSGAWVVDATTGDLYGVIVAASSVVQEGYLIPASEITNDIRRATGELTVELPKRAAFSHAPQRLNKNEGIDGLFTAENAIDYRKSLKVTFDRPGWMDHELRQPDAMQTSHLDVREEGSHSEDTIASHYQSSETVLGKEYPDTLTSRKKRGQGNYTETETLVTKDVFSKEPSNMLTSMNNQALMLSSQGKYQEAEKIHRQVLELMETVFENRHPNILTSMNHLAEVLSSQGKYEEAKEIYIQVLTSRERMLEKKHPDTLKSMNNLAEVLSIQGRYEEAEEMHSQALALMKTILGKEHPSTLTSMNNLAGAISNQHRHEEAEEMYRQALALMETILGKEHPSTLISMNNLAEVLSRQGKYEEAEKMYRQTLPLMEMVLGHEHPDTLTSDYGLAYLLHQTKRYKDAEVFYHRAYSGYRKTLGEKHPTTTACSRHFFLMLKEDKGWEDSEMYWAKVEKG